MYDGKAMRGTAKLLVAALVTVCMCIGLVPLPAVAGPSPQAGLRGTGLHMSQPQDPALEGIRIEVLSRDPAHRADRVGAAANSALSSLSLPRPMPHFAPPARRVRTLVGVDTWFWVTAASWRPIVRFAALGAVVVTLVATPVVLQLAPGDGSALVSCGGPGIPWLKAAGRSLCSHTFQRTSMSQPFGRFGAKVQTVWTIRWISNTGLSGIVGPVVVSTPVALRVAEAQAVLSR